MKPKEQEIVHAMNPTPLANVGELIETLERIQMQGLLKGIPRSLHPPERRDSEPDRYIYLSRPDYRKKT